MIGGANFPNLVSNVSTVIDQEAGTFTPTDLLTFDFKKLFAGYLAYSNKDLYFTISGDPSLTATARIYIPAYDTFQIFCTKEEAALHRYYIDVPGGLSDGIISFAALHQV